MEDNLSFNELIKEMTTFIINNAVEDETKSGWCTVSQIVGWIYFAAWSVSFYGQIYINWKSKSVKGLSYDFQFYNLTGFLGYTIYNVWGYTDSRIGVDGVQIQDVLFACHALLATIITLIQIVMYRDPLDPKQRISHLAISIVVCIWWGFFIIILIEQILGMYDPYSHEGKSFAFNSVIYLGFTKAFISLIKYIPQVYMNYSNKSTKGWSIFNILLDFTGGSFSLIQNLIDQLSGCGKIIVHDDKYLLNVVKYAVSIIAMFFDIIFMIQHYCLYRKSEDEEVIDRLINNEEENNFNNDA